MSLSAPLLGLLLAATPPVQETDGCPGTMVFFASDSAELDAQASAVLAMNWQWMRPMVEAGAWLNLEGRADQVGPASYNLDLSRRRAESVRRYFLRLGVHPGQLRVQALGESTSMTPRDADPASERAREQNRSVYVGPEMTLDVFHRFFPPGGPIC